MSEVKRPDREMNALALELPRAVYDDAIGKIRAYMDHLGSQHAADQQQLTQLRTQLDDERRRGDTYVARVAERDQTIARLRAMVGELVAIVECVDFEDDRDAPNNDDMNRWHDAALAKGGHDGRD